MESEKAKQTVLRKSFTICTNNIKKAIEDGKSSTDDFIALQELLQDAFRRLAENQEIVYCFGGYPKQRRFHYDV
ncbi:hypothetical protein TNCV_3509811 [Trichonephila clavipes]|nr:hypothetical protein TNCV_3509811 [Trichonephila clavipes]